VQTDKTILNNNQDTTVHDNEQGPYLLIDVAVSRDRNVIQREPGKILQYQ
jgi:hypothetical protein